MTSKNPQGVFSQQHFLCCVCWLKTPVA